MHLPPICRSGILLRRYKRFLADVLLDDNQLLTVHCPNSGAMRGCSTPGSPVVISRAENPKRKFAWTLEMVQHDSTWIGVNTARSNTLVAEALADGTIDDFGALRRIVPEIRVSAKTRLDFLLESDRGNVFLEVKNCSLVENRVALFPDAVTARGTRHLLELIRLTEAGNRGALLFCVQRGDAIICSPAGHIDRIYAQTLVQAVAKGVTCLAYKAEVTPSQIALTEKIPFAPYSFEATVTP